MMKKYWIVFFLMLLLTNFSAWGRELNTGPWRFYLRTTHADIPFIIEFSYKGKNLVGTLKNGKEKILLDEMKDTTGNLVIPLQTYELSLELTLQDENAMSGYLVRHNKNPIVKTPVIGSFGIKQRFSFNEKKVPGVSLEGKWSLTMIDENNQKSPAIGNFTQKGRRFSGSILTGTGDYRYLDGIVSENSFEAASFDGVYNYLFRGQIKNGKLEATLVSPIAALNRIDAVAGNAVLTLTRPVLSTPDLAFSLTEATAALTIADGALRVWNINLKDAQNVVRGEVLWPLNKQAANVEIQIDADCPSLSAAQLQIRGQPVTGSLQINIANQRGTGPLTTTCDALGTNLNWGTFGPVQLRMTASSVDKTISAQTLELDFGPQDHLRAQGEVAISNEVPYKINATLTVAKLEKMRPLFAQLGINTPLGGALNVIWKGEGTLANFVGEGEWSLQLRDANWDKLKLKILDCSGHYSPGSLTQLPSE
jgi:hypothetical protein